MAVAVAKSNLFGVKTPDQALALMLLCQGEGIHPMIAVRDYHIIQGRPALKSDAMLARFQVAGGVIKWKDYTDEKVSAEFSHPSCPEPVLIVWDIQRAKQAGVYGRDNWRNYPRQMLKARVISEGVRATYPASCVGIYTPEEVQDFNSKPTVSIPEPVIVEPAINPTKMAVEAPKKAEEPKKAQVVDEAEIVPPKANTPQETAITEPVKEAPKKKTVKEQLAAAKKALREEYDAYLLKAGIKEEDINDSNVKMILRGMRVRYEEIKNGNI